MNMALSPAARSALLSLVGALAVVGSSYADPDFEMNGMTVGIDATGVMGTLSVAGRVDKHNEFFQSLGTNGRSCATCHVAEQAMSFTPAHARRLYEKTGGADPLFASVDGANCNTVVPGDRAGHSSLINNGLIRIGMAVPVNAEFSISVAHDPYGCALQIDPKTHVLTASVYRRPLPTPTSPFSAP